MTISRCAGGHLIRDEGTELAVEPFINLVGGLVRGVDDPANSETEIRVGLQPDGTDLFATSNVAPHLTIGIAGKIIALRDTLRFATAGVAHLQDSAANEHLRLVTGAGTFGVAGGLQVASRIGIGTAPATNRMLDVLLSNLSAAGDPQLVAINTSAVTLTGANRTLIGLFGFAPANVTAATTGHIFEGLNFLALIGSGDAATVAARMTGCKANAGIFAYTGAVTLMQQYYAPSPSNIFGDPGPISLNLGMDMDDQGSTAAVTNAIGLRIAAITLNTGYRRLLELGLNPELRLESGNPTNPGASKGRSNLLLTFNENGVIAAVRRVEWKSPGLAGAALVAADRVLVAL